MIEVLIVAELLIVGEGGGRLVNIDGGGDPAGPPIELVQLRFRKDGALDTRYELSERADVHPYCLTTGGDGFDEGGAPADMGIEHQIPRLGERLDRGPGK